RLRRDRSREAQRVARPAEADRPQAAPRRDRAADVVLPRITRRKSRVHGHGVFAAQPITKNTRIIDYAGELVRNGKACEARETRYLEDGCIWIFRVNRAWSRD